MRKTFLRNLPDVPPRIPVDKAHELATGRSSRKQPPLEAADEKAAALRDVFEKLLEADADLNRDCKRFNNQLIDLFDAFLKRVEDLNGLRRCVKEKLKADRDPLLTAGVFDIFPNVLCQVLQFCRSNKLVCPAFNFSMPQDRYEHLLSKHAAVSSVFVDVLAACGVDEAWLGREAADLNALFSSLKARTFKRLPREQTYKVERQFDSCVAAAVDWAGSRMVAASASRKRRRSDSLAEEEGSVASSSRSRGRSPARQRHRSSLGPRTPPPAGSPMTNGI